MSLSLVPATTDVARVLQHLPPGSQVVLAFVTLPSAPPAASPVTSPDDERVDESPVVTPPSGAPATDEPPPSPRGGLPVGGEAVTQAMPQLRLLSYDGAVPRARRHSPSAALARLDSLWTEVAASTRRLRDWARLLDLSERELRRAVQERAVVATPKPDGRDHGTPMITAHDLRAYLELVVAVELSRVEAPKWWRAVRRRAA